MPASARIHDTLDRLERWLREHQPAFLDAMRPGATDAEIDDLERAIGRTLPDDVRAFYRWRAGVNAEAYPWSRTPFWERPLTLDEIRTLYQEWRHRGETFWRESDFGPGYWHPGWVPFMGDEDDGCYCADTAGIWTGTQGQIIEFQVGSDSRCIVAGSLHDWLRILVADLERGIGFDSDGHRTDTLNRYPLGYTQSHDVHEVAVVPDTPPVTPPRAKPAADAFRVGDRVRVLDGSFQNMEGPIRQLNSGAWTVSLTLTFWERPIDVELEAWQLEVIERAPQPATGQELPQPDTRVWEECADAGTLFGFLGFAPSARKFQLLVVACYCDLLGGDQADSLGDALTKFVDGAIGIAEIRETLEDFWLDTGVPHAPRGDVLPALYRGVEAGNLESLAPDLIRNGHATPDLVRDIFPNPLTPPQFDPAWRTPDVTAVARGVYDARAFDGLPVLADALQEAGCDNDELLNHLRDTSRAHVRGCWALDLCLGLE